MIEDKYPYSTYIISGSQTDEKNGLAKVIKTLGLNDDYIDLENAYKEYGLKNFYYHLSNAYQLRNVESHYCSEVGANKLTTLLESVITNVCL